MVEALKAVPEWQQAHQAAQVAAQNGLVLILQAVVAQLDKDLLVVQPAMLREDAVVVVLEELVQQVEPILILATTQLATMVATVVQACHLQHRAHYNGMQAVAVAAVIPLVQDLEDKAALAEVATVVTRHWTACVV